MEDMNEEQNYYPSAEPVPPVSEYIYVHPKTRRCRMCYFLVPAENTLCPTCRTPRRFHIGCFEMLLIAFLLIFFILMGGVFILIGFWNDSPVPLPPEFIAYQQDMLNLSFWYVFCPPISFFFLRYYGGVFATIASLASAIILLFDIFYVMTKLAVPSSASVYNLQIISIVIFSIFFVVPLVSGTILRRRAWLQRNDSGLDDLPHI